MDRKILISIITIDRDSHLIEKVYESIKEYLKSHGLNKDEAMKIICDSITMDNKIPKIDTSYLSIVVSIFLIPVMIKIMDWYLIKYDVKSINYSIELIKISIISIGLMIFSFQIIQILSN